MARRAPRGHASRERPGASERPPPRPGTCGKRHLRVRPRPSPSPRSRIPTQPESFVEGRQGQARRGHDEDPEELEHGAGDLGAGDRASGSRLAACALWRRPGLRGTGPPMPQADFPAGLPSWMHEQDGWAKRTGADDLAKRRNITLTVPKGHRPMSRPERHLVAAHTQSRPFARTAASAVGRGEARPDRPSHRSSASRLAGRVVTMDDAFTVKDDAVVYVDKGRIVAVQKRRAGAARRLRDSRRSSRPDGTLFPGLIELHNHLSYNALPLWPRAETVHTPRPVADHKPTIAAHQRPDDGHRPVSGRRRASRRCSPRLIRYVECKCLLGGVTTSQGDQARQQQRDPALLPRDRAQCRADRRCRICPRRRRGSRTWRPRTPALS